MGTPKECEHLFRVLACNQPSNRTSWFLFHVLTGICSNTPTPTQPCDVCQRATAALMNLETGDLLVSQAWEGILNSTDFGDSLTFFIE